MPNRIIKESICVSEQIDELNPFEETFFYRLLVNCDDYGCMDAREKVLAAKLYPLKAVKPKDIMSALDRLAEVGLIGLYEIDNHLYLKVLKWADHQRVRISKHKYPEPTEELLAASCGNSRQVAANGGELQQTAANGGNLRPESNPIQSNTNTNPNPNPNQNPTRARARESKPDYEPLFSSFWDAYPRKESKPDARKAFEKLKPDESLLQTMLAAIEKQKATAQWQDDGGRYIPHPSTWLNNRRWEDEVQPAAQSKPQDKKTVVAQDYEQRDYSETGEESMTDQMARLKRMMEEGL